MKSYKRIDQNIFVIENEQQNTSITYDHNEYAKIVAVTFVKDYYDYNKPHNQTRYNHDATWRLITCMFGVIICTCGDHKFELSRENKKQLMIGPNINFEYYNQSGKSVCHVRSSA
tara:strand:+ start:758 stop:1102 length:345 start_codon:yes stop_codon:yes gene_type:complete